MHELNRFLVFLNLLIPADVLTSCTDECGCSPDPCENRSSASLSDIDAENGDTDIRLLSSLLYSLEGTWDGTVEVPEGEVKSPRGRVVPPCIVVYVDIQGLAQGLMARFFRRHLSLPNPSPSGDGGFRLQM